MGDGDEEQIVLHRVEERGNEQQQRVLPLEEDFLDDDLALSTRNGTYLQSSNESRLHAVENGAADHFQSL